MFIVAFLYWEYNELPLKFGPFKKNNNCFVFLDMIHWHKGGCAMNVLMLGGTRFFGVHTVRALLRGGHEVTIATRGRTPDGFGRAVKRVTLERTDPDSMREALKGQHYDAVIDKIAYCSNDIRYAMDALDCDRYIYMSTTAVYDPKRMETPEEDFDGRDGTLVWCDRQDFPYAVVKRHAERALCQVYPDKPWVAVRYPFVVGTDDYTRRLHFYVEHVMKGIPMNIDNIDAPMGYIRSDEAGEFMAYLVDRAFTGAINGCSPGAISLREMLDYIERRTGCRAMLDSAGNAAPYNGEPPYSIQTRRAEALGFKFSDVRAWMFTLLDELIAQGR